MTWQGDDYQARFDQLAATGSDVHGEATFVRAYEPRSVLDAGCGTGRVAIELARHGIEVMGGRCGRLDDRHRPAGVAGAQLGGSRPHHLRPRPHRRRRGACRQRPSVHAARQQVDLVAHTTRHVAVDGRLVAGFSVDRGYGIDEWDAHTTAAGLVLAERFATWDRAPWRAGGAYAVSVHRRAS